MRKTVQTMDGAVFVAGKSKECTNPSCTHFGKHYYAYNGELILQPQQRWTPEEQLELLDAHPMFTGRCPQCGYEFDRDWSARVHWDCPECGWMDDTV